MRLCSVLLSLPDATSARAATSLVAAATGTSLMLHLRPACEVRTPVCVVPPSFVEAHRTHNFLPIPPPPCTGPCHRGSRSKTRRHTPRIDLRLTLSNPSHFRSFCFAADPPPPVTSFHPPPPSSPPQLPSTPVSSAVLYCLKGLFCAWIAHLRAHPRPPTEGMHPSCTACHPANCGATQYRHLFFATLFLLVR